VAGDEDDGTPTGLHAEHRELTGLEGLIAARSSPSLAVKVARATVRGVSVARISIAKSGGEVATSNGVYLRRRLRHDGAPECVPMLPHDRASRETRFGLHDASSQVVTGASLSDFDPIEREPLRQSIQHYGGDRVLLDLDDEAIDGALGLRARNSQGHKARPSPVSF
jgi:ATP-dependent DNA helicase RecG